MANPVGKQHSMTARLEIDRPDLIGAIAQRSPADCGQKQDTGASTAFNARLDSHSPVTEALLRPPPIA